MRRSYRDVLREEFSSRVAKNARYSLRAFAKFIGLSPTSLSLIINGKQGLGRRRAQTVAARLGLSPADAQAFIENADQVVSGPRDLSPELLGPGETDQDIIKNWYNLAILEMTELTNVDVSEENFQTTIAKKLGINELAAKLAVEDLVRLGLLEVQVGRYVQTTKEAFVGSKTPSRSIRSFHHQMIAKAQSAIEEVPVDQRDLGAVIVPISDADYEWAIQEIKKLRRKLLKRNSANGEKTGPYCLTTQFFSLLQ